MSSFRVLAWRLLIKHLPKESSTEKEKRQGLRRGRAKEHQDHAGNDLSKEDQAEFDKIPNPKPLLSFSQAVATRGEAGGNAEAAHRCATLLHLANISIRTGRKIQYDPVKEQIIGDEEANRLVNPPMRAPWHL